MSSTAEELSAQAEQLQTAVEFFKVDGGERPARRAMSGKGAASGKNGHLVPLRTAQVDGPAAEPVKYAGVGPSAADGRAR